MPHLLSQHLHPEPGARRGLPQHPGPPLRWVGACVRGCFFGGQEGQHVEWRGRQALLGHACEHGGSVGPAAATAALQGHHASPFCSCRAALLQCLTAWQAASRGPSSRWVGTWDGQTWCWRGPGSGNVLSKACLCRTPRLSTDANHSRFPRSSSSPVGRAPPFSQAVLLHGAWHDTAFLPVPLLLGCRLATARRARRHGPRPAASCGKC